MKKSDQYREVYSTDRGAICSQCSQPTNACKCSEMKSQVIKGSGDVKIRLERKGRGGKTVTTISGLAMTRGQLTSLLSELKRLIGGGGTEKDGILELQGDHCELLVRELLRRGIKARHLISLSLFFLLSLFMSLNVSATPTDAEGWLLLGSNIGLDSKDRYKLYLETQPRVGDDFQRLATLQLRSAINYAFAPQWSFALGHAWTPIFYDADYHRIYRDENRVWQGLSFTHIASGITLQQRIRQEQRFIEHASAVSHRSRYQLRGSVPISANGDFGITAFDEFMVHLNSVDRGPVSGYDRNRVFIGPFWENSETRYEFGYLGEHMKRFGDNERWINAIMLSIVSSL